MTVYHRGKCDSCDYTTDVTDYKGFKLCEVCIKFDMSKELEK